MKLVIGNDNGNSEHDIIINGELIQSPNSNIILSSLPFGYDNKNIDLETELKDLQNNIVVTINSGAVKKNGLYVVGVNALKMEYIDNMQVGIDNKYTHDLPIINTLSQIAVYAVKKEPKKETITVHVDMSTALPISQYNESTAKQFKFKFMENKHSVIVHIKGCTVEVKIIFDYVKVLPEGVPAVFAITEIDEFRELRGKKILHIDIGDGTTEYPVTNGISFVKEYISGTNNGLGYAIDNVLPSFRNDIKVLDMNRQYFSDILKTKSHKYHTRAINAIKHDMSLQANQIYKKTIDQLSKTKNDIDIIFVYGGGSILMKQELVKDLEELATEREVDLVYCPAIYAVTLNARGLYAFSQSDIFKTLKETHNGTN